MVERIEAFRATDGRICTCERDAVLHDATLRLRQVQNPRLRSSISAIIENADEILAALSPLAGLSDKPPLDLGETTLDVTYIGPGGERRTAGVAG